MNSLQDNPATSLRGPGERYSEGVEPRPVLGRPVRLQVGLRRGWLRSAWVALCGALASGGLALAGETLLQLALLLFLVDIVWGGLWLALAGTDWAAALRHWQDWDRGSPVRLLPYTLPEGPAGRLAQTWGHLRSWWADMLQPTLGPTLVGLALLLPLAVVVAGVLGAHLLLLTLAAITLLQFIVAWSGGDARPVPGPQALFEIVLPWLAGHALFEPPTLPSTLLALGYALAYAGGLRLAQGWPGLARWNLGQVVAVIVLVASRQPLAAGGVGLFLVGQAIAQPGLLDVETERVEPAAAARFLRFAGPWLMASMLVSAWGLQAAGAGG